MCSEDIVIDLTRSNVENSLPAEQVIQRDAIARFKILLDEAVHAARLSKTSVAGRPQRLDNAIIFNGSRGSGKSTLLNLVLEEFQSGDVYRVANGRTSRKNNVLALNIIEPSLIETKDNIIVLVIQLIMHEVETPHNVGNLTEWRNLLEKLADGLIRLDNIGKDNPHEDWDDPLYVMETGLRRAEGATSFEQSFDAFLRKSLELMSIDLLIIPFDDIDTAFSRGFDVLEAIRKYLASPLVLVVVSGDLSLYSKLIRLDFSSKLADRLPQVEEPYLQNYERAIDELEDQYLMKLFKPSSRIDLLRLGDIARNHRNTHKGKIACKLTGDDSNAARTIQEVIGSFVTTIYRVTPADTNLYVELILEQPVRSVIQFLRAIETNRSMPNQSDSGETTIERDVYSAIAQVFSGPLARRNLTINQVVDSEESDRLVLLRKMFTKYEMWTSGYRMRPDFEDDDDNLSIVAISGPLTDRLNARPSHIIEYFIKVCLPHEVSRYVDSVADASMEMYLEYVSRGLHEDMLAEARRNAAVVVCRNISGRSTWPPEKGVLMVYGAKRPGLAAYTAFLTGGSEDKRFLQKFIGQVEPNVSPEMLLQNGQRDKLSNTWKTLIKRLGIADSETQMSRVCSLLACQVAFKDGTVSTYCSVLNLIAAIGRMLETVSDESVAGRRARLDFESALAGCSQGRSFPIPDWVKTTGGEDSEDGTGDDEVEEDSNSLAEADNSLSTAFMGWSTDFRSVLSANKASAHFFSRVWSRFYFTSVGVCSDIPQKERYLGFMVHRLVVAFLNAFMVEEITLLNLKPAAGKFGLSNPITDDRVFVSNLRLLLRMSDVAPATNDASTHATPAEEVSLKEKLINKLPIFTEVLCCPIWAAFISPEEVLTKRGDEDLFRCNNLLDFQRSLWSDANSTDGAGSGIYPQVSYSVPRRAVVTFPNLYHPLNSVLMVSRHRNASK